MKNGPWNYLIQGALPYSVRMAIGDFQMELTVLPIKH